MNDTTATKTGLEKQMEAMKLLDKVLRATSNGKHATVKRKTNGELCVYAVDMKITE